MEPAIGVRMVDVHRVQLSVPAHHQDADGGGSQHAFAFRVVRYGLDRLGHFCEFFLWCEQIGL
jgi:hypothetical protein